MIRRKMVWGLVWIGAVCALTFGCGSIISTTITTPDTGGLILIVSDTPACNVLAYRMSFGGLILRSNTQGNAANAYKGVIAPNIVVNFGGLRDTSSVLRVAPVTVGTYDQADFSFGQGNFTYFDPTNINLTSTVFPNAAAASGIIQIQPPLTIAKGAISALRIDLDVRHSVTVNADGTLAPATRPALAISPVTANSVTGFGRMQDMRGFVLSVTSGSTISQFLGTLNVQFHTGTSGVPQLPVNIASTTTIYSSAYPMGIQGTDPDIKRAIGGILGGSFVEVDGYVDPKGNLVADTIEVEDQENIGTHRSALIGTIMGITRDLAGNVTQFTYYVGESQPDSVFNVPDDALVQVNTASTTTFNVSSRAVNFASLPFSSVNMAVGQQIIVHGPTTGGTTNNKTTIDADSIYLRLQTHDGNFSSIVSAGSDDRTGAFWLKSCCTVFQGNPILVITNNNTSFVNLIGLSGLTPQPDLAVKGLLFYEPQSVMINGVSVPAGTLVMLADQVHAVS